MLNKYAPLRYEEAKSSSFLDSPKTLLIRENSSASNLKNKYNRERKLRSQQDKLIRSDSIFNSYNTISATNTQCGAEEIDVKQAQRLYRGLKNIRQVT